MNNRSDRWTTKPGAAMAALLLASALVAACSTSSTKGDAATPSHSASADSLKLVMRGFDAEVRAKVPADTDVHDRWEGVFPKIAAASAELAVSANDLSGHPPGRLELPDRGRYQVLGQALVEAAKQLEAAANARDADAVAAARTRVGGACRDCHSRFRPETPGIPEAFR